MTHEKTIVRRRQLIFWAAATLLTAIMFSLVIRNETSAQKETTTTAELPKTALAATEIYSNNFESAVGAEWRNVQTNQIPPTSVTPIGARRFLGEFGNNEIRLSLNSLPAHNRVSVVFDLYVIRTWDGNNTEYGLNLFQFGYDGQTLKRTTFCFTPQTKQAYPANFLEGEYDGNTGASEINTLGYTYFDGQSVDSVYQISQAFSHTSNSLQLNFSANGLQALTDESWGIDNVRVIVDTLANDTQTTLMPYESGGYRYQILPTTQTVPAGFEQPNYDDSAWSVGQASFGYNDGCVFPFNLKTHWQTNTRLILRKNVYVPPGATNLGVKLSVDNDIEKIWFNGIQIADFQLNDSCPLRDEYGYSIPQNLVQTGNNLIAYQVIDRGRQTFFDSRIVADYPVSCSIPTNGLVSWWKGEGNANDSFGTNNGTLQNGATFAPGKIGQAFSFDGVDDFVSFGNSVGNFGTSNFTVDFWVKTTSTRLESLIGKRSNCTNSSMIESRLNGGASIGFEVGNDYINATANKTINDGVFHHIALVRQNNTLQIYIDGVLERTATGSGIADISNVVDLIAGRSACTGIDGTNYLTGQLDEIKIYNRALSATEVYNTYAAGNSQTCQLNSTSIEGDVAERPNGDGLILSNDIVQIRRFLNGTNTPDPATNEFQRADSSPFADKGDGVLNSADVVQTRRYQNGTSPLQPAGGPTLPNQPQDLTDQFNKTEVESKSPEGNPREMRVESTTTSAGQMVTVNIRVDAAGDESEYGFILDYDPGVLSNPVIGAGSAGVSIRSCNKSVVGQINCSVGGFAGNNTNTTDLRIGEIEAETNQILMTVTFTVAADAAGDTPLKLSNVNASSDAPQLFTPRATGGMVTILVPADYDGDGRTDIAVYRATEGNWYVQRSTQGFTAMQFGANNDRPIPNAFVP